MKILHLPTSVGGNSYGLAEAEKSIGLESRVLYTNADWLQYPADIVVQRKKSKIGDSIQLIKTAFKIYDKYDIYHYNFGSSLLEFPGLGMELLELPFIDDRKIVVTYNGCDARQKYARMQQTDICACKYEACYAGVCMDKGIEERKKKRIEKFKKCGATFLSLNPDIMNFLPSSTQFLPYTVAAWHEIETDYRPKKYTNLQKIKIVHAPTNRVTKGSDAVIEIINRLQKKYPNYLELVLVENQPYQEALKIYKTADLVIDQLRVGWYGAFATEVMKMGKPVIAYINEQDLHFIPKTMAKECMEAIISANEYTLEATLEEIINNIKILKEKNEAQLEYVYKWHDPKYVASLTKKIYQDKQEAL